MKRLHELILLFWLIQLNIVPGASKSNLDKECSVKSEQVFRLQEDTNLNVSFYITSEDQICFHISFVGLAKHENNDLVILRPKAVRIQRKRDGEATTYDDNIINDIPLGWNYMTVILQDGNLNFGNFYSLIGMKYNISDISVTAKYMTDCENRTPIWEINELKEVHIPLLGLSAFEITLSKDQTFSPHLILNDLQIPLSYDKELFLGKSIEPLPADDYRMVIVKHISHNMIYIFTISIHEEYKLLMSTKINEDLIDLKVKSLGGNFYLILDPFLKENYEVDTTITKSGLIMQRKYEEINMSEYKTTPDLHAMEIVVKCDAPFHVVWKITTVLFAVVAAVSLFVNYYYHSRNKNEKFQEFEMEEGEPLVEKAVKISAKLKIRSEKTELNGEFNPELGYQKGICKLRLVSDQNNRHKKSLGEMDSQKQTKVILVVGETGSGKSSTINVMINHLYGIKFEDPFRLKLVDVMDSLQKSGINTTEEITSYYIPFTPGIINDSNYIFIDTPGFGDLRGIDEDTKLVTKFHEFLKENSEIDELDAICFVIKASDTRLTDIQKYIIGGLFSMFGKDVIRNIYAVVTYSDGSITHVPKLLKNSGLEYQLEMHVNSIGFFNDSKGIKDLSQTEIKEHFHESWDMTMSNMDQFFSVLKKKRSVSLILTHIVLEENEDITKITDELLQLIEMEEISTDAEQTSIQAKIEQNQSLMMKLVQEAIKLSGRLKNIPAKENPLTMNDYIDILMSRAKDENKVIELKKMKKRNTKFQSILSKKVSKNYNPISYLFGGKNEKMD